MTKTSRQTLHDAIARNAGLVLSLPVAGMLRHHKSRFLGEAGAYARELRDAWPALSAGDVPGFFAKARPAGWRSLTIPAQSDRPPFTILFDLTGRYRYERKLSRKERKNGKRISRVLSSLREPPSEGGSFL